MMLNFQWVEQLHDLLQTDLKVGVVDLTKAELSTRGDVKTRANETAAASKILKLKIRENLGIEDGNISISSKFNKKSCAS